MSLVLIMMEDCCHCDTAFNIIEQNNLPIHCMMGIQRMDFKLSKPHTGMFRLKKPDGSFMKDHNGDLIELGPFSEMPVLVSTGSLHHLRGLDEIKPFIEKTFQVDLSKIDIFKSTKGVVNVG